jgi:hypothetical protein
MGFQDMDLPQTPQFRDRLNTQDGDEFPQEAGMLSHVHALALCFSLAFSKHSQLLNLVLPGFA